jgi:hypothetical protein
MSTLESMITTTLEQNRCDFRFTRKPCPRCAGCGKLADDTDGTPWKYWLELPLQSAVAVVACVVRPVNCALFDGTGYQIAEA